jgi:hypothetical protein
MKYENVRVMSTNELQCEYVLLNIAFNKAKADEAKSDMIKLGKRIKEVRDENNARINAPYIK